MKCPKLINITILKKIKIKIHSIALNASGVLYFVEVKVEMAFSKLAYGNEVVNPRRKSTTEFRRRRLTQTK